MSVLIPEQRTTPLERAQWDYDRACLLLEKAKAENPQKIHEAIKRQSDTYGALLVAKHKAGAQMTLHPEGAAQTGGDNG